MFGERKVFTINHLPGKKAKLFLMDGYNFRETGNGVEPGWMPNYQGVRLEMIPPFFVLGLMFLRLKGQAKTIQVCIHPHGCYGRP